jgi:oxygen-independent coproporphyrinogen-3 oxidase
LAASDPGRLSLYVHVPYCASKCRYCDFFSVPIDPDEGSGGMAGRVVGETLVQLERFLQQAPPVRFETVYVGGGTPSVLPHDLLERLLGGLSRLGPSEWTVEANPESLDRAFLGICEQAGVTRLSVGLQSMDDRLLARLGRPGTVSDNARALELIADAWKGDVSFDLIAGIPGQSREATLADIADVTATGCGHASLYALTVEPGTPLAGLVDAGCIALNTRDHDEELWLAGRDAFEDAGLHQYEVSNLARPGGECRHNLRYWHLEPYLGIGPGAASTLPPDLATALTGERSAAAVVRLSNPRGINAFLSGAENSSGAPWGIESEAITYRSFLLETLMMGLRLTGGISAESFRRRFGQGLDRLVPGLWQRWTEQGFAAPQTGSLRFTDRGLLILDTLMRELAGELREARLPRTRISWPDRAPEY